MMIIAGLDDRCGQVLEPVSPFQSGLGRLESGNNVIDIQLGYIGRIIRLLESVRKGKNFRNILSQL